MPDGHEIRYENQITGEVMTAWAVDGLSPEQKENSEPLAEQIEDLCNRSFAEGRRFGHWETGNLDPTPPTVH